MSPIKPRPITSVALVPGLSTGGAIAFAMKYLASAGPTATGITMISPDGAVRYISRAEAERFCAGPEPDEVRQ